MRGINRRKNKIGSKSGVQESIYIDANGIKQYLQICGENTDNPKLYCETIKNILPAERLDIKFKVLDENKRLLIFEPHGRKYEELCEAVLWKLYL